MHTNYYSVSQNTAGFDVLYQIQVLYEGKLAT